MMVAALRDNLLVALRDAAKRAYRLNRPVLAVASLAVPQPDLLGIFDRYWPRLATSLWLGTGAHALLGLGIATECRARGADRFASIALAWRTAIRDAVVVGEAGPIAMGGFRFDTDRPVSALWRGFPDGSLVVPRLAIRCQAGLSRLILADLVPVGVDAERRVDALLASWADSAAEAGASGADGCGLMAVAGAADEKEQWVSLVQRALDAIDHRDLEKVVAARMLRLESSRPIPLLHVLRRLRADNPAACVFAFRRHGASFIGATPETLFTADAGSFRTMALAGSAPRSEDPVLDARLGQELLACAKERFEHDVVVRTIRQALEPLCVRIAADASPSLQKLRRVQHLVTHFTGELQAGRSLLDIVGRLHPTPAVGGVPLGPALAFLRDHEGIDRGWYAGPVGWLDAKGSGEFMVSLRSGLISGRCASLFAGCGLVAGSNPEAEFQETQLKFATMLEGIDPNRAGLAPVLRQ
ncbi:MAG: isochorismate synthase MenF [Desulfovibrionaceae bacterium]